MISALFVETNGVYFGLPNVDPWDENRDAMQYNGPHPVIAHPPCARWCRLAGFVESQYGYKIGDDGGTFKHALNCVREFGGILEHPAYSKAWDKYCLPIPPRTGGWQGSLFGGYSAHVEQGRYGHQAKKATWLYAFGIDVKPLNWGATPDSEVTHMVSWCGNRISADADRPRLGPKEAKATPIEFRDTLISLVGRVN